MATLHCGENAACTRSGRALAQFRGQRAGSGWNRRGAQPKSATAGAWSATFSAPGYRSQTVLVNLAPGATEIIAVDLVPG